MNTGFTVEETNLISIYIYEDRVSLPLRYNYDKPEKPRIARVFGYQARFSILFQTEKSSQKVVVP